MEIKVDCFDIRQIADSGQCFRFKQHPTREDTFTVVVGGDYIEITQAAGSHTIELSCDMDAFANKKYFIKTHSFIPASRVDEHIKTDKVPYDVWIEKGLVTPTYTLGGIKTDYKYILSYLQMLIEEYNLKPQMICYDPHNASAFLSDLEAMGWDSISITQTAKELNDATVDFRLEILTGNIEIEGVETGKERKKVVPVDELLTWSIANAKTISNNYGEIKIDKDISEDRIDPIDAIIDAWKLAMKDEYKKKTRHVKCRGR